MKEAETVSDAIEAQISQRVRDDLEVIVSAVRTFASGHARSRLETKTVDLTDLLLRAAADRAFESESFRAALDLMVSAERKRVANFRAALDLMVSAERKRVAQAIVRGFNDSKKKEIDL